MNNSLYELFNVKCLVLAGCIVALYYITLILTRQLDHHPSILYASTSIAFVTSILVVDLYYSKAYNCKHASSAIRFGHSVLSGLVIATVPAIAFWVMKRVRTSRPQFEDTHSAYTISPDNKDDDDESVYVIRKPGKSFVYYMNRMAMWGYLPFFFALLFYVLMAWYDHWGDCDWKMHVTPISLPTAQLKPSSYQTRPQHLRKFTRIGTIFYASFIVVTIIPVAILSHTKLRLV